MPIEYNVITKKYLYLANIHILDILYTAINDGFYIYTHVDEFYVPYSSHTQKRHFFHDILIYGYNQNKKVIYTIGYGSDGEYSLREISMEDLTTAFYSDKYKQEEHNIFDESHIYLIKTEPV